MVGGEGKTARPPVYIDRVFRCAVAEDADVISAESFFCTITSRSLLFRCCSASSLTIEKE